MKTKKLISLILAAVMLVGFSAMCISCDGNDTPDDKKDKIIVSVEVYYTDSDGAEAIFLRNNELEVDAGISVNDALIALINAREATYVALSDGSVDSITFGGDTIKQHSAAVSSNADSATFKNTHFVWTVNGATPENATSVTCKVNDGDKIVYKLVTEEQTVTQ
ncbi:MAG: hypothetical protein SO533_06625 [Eubacteriales bacterium]|nr:hypothetical protein [Clostridiales bacterium]MDD7595631.1 hypothetical protein [Clostridiales bacterium]MDY4887299.1 hypothetical protein [Eubacteriales bacterium]MDY5859994.1 hypothetical protein [Eubacteriales bacterium]